jgi:addiction module HigA family antidote
MRIKLSLFSLYAILLNFQTITTDMITLPNVDTSMIANNLTPYEPTHPGSLIREELEERKMTQAKLAEQIGVSLSLLNEVVNGKRNINTELALLLEAALGISAHIWLDLQSDYNMQVAKSDVSFMRKLANIRNIAAVL